jgi:putative ABC transport system permease protein
VLVPDTLSCDRLRGGRGRHRSAARSCAPLALLGSVQEELSDLLRQRHEIRSGGGDDFTVQNLGSISKTMQQTSGTFANLIANVAAVSLLVGGIGIMNVMLASGTEQTPRDRIGARRAPGVGRHGDNENSVGFGL